MAEFLPPDSFNHFSDFWLIYVIKMIAGTKSDVQFALTVT
jgi:hypothetical protein